MTITWTGGTHNEQVKHKLCYTKSALYGGGLICSQPFEMTFTECDYLSYRFAQQIAMKPSSSVTEVNFSNIKSELIAVQSKLASCFNGVGDGLYTNCDTTPVMMSNTNLKTHGGSETIIEFTANSLVNNAQTANICVCVGNYQSELICTESFTLSVADTISSTCIYGFASPATRNVPTLSAGDGYKFTDSFGAVLDEINEESGCFSS